MNKLVLSTAEPIEEIAYRLKAMPSGIKHNINLIDKEKFSISHNIILLFVILILRIKLKHTDILPGSISLRIQKEEFVAECLHANLNLPKKLMALDAPGIIEFIVHEHYK